MPLPSRPSSHHPSLSRFCLQVSCIVYCASSFSFTPKQNLDHQHLPRRAKFTSTKSFHTSTSALILHDRINGDDFGENRKRPRSRPRPSNNRDGKREKDLQSRLESSLSSLFDISSPRPSPDGDSNSGRDDRNADETLGSIDISSDEYRIQDDAPKLINEDIYRNSEQYIDEDGSIKGMKQSRFDKDQKELLSSITNASPEIPQEMMGKKKFEELKGGATNEQLLLDFMNQEKNTEANKNSPDAEELHSRIFANEEGFLEQSDLFRKSLSAEDQAELDKANAWRRGADYRRRQQEAMSLLEKEMEEMEQNALSMDEAKQLAMEQNQQHEKENRNTSEPATVLCSKCACLLSQEEIMAENKRGRTGTNEKTCRLCQLEDLESKFGSPYLMGRVDRKTGQPPPRLGISRDELYQQKEDELRRIGPQTSYDDAEDFSFYASRPKGKKAEEEKEKWRASFTAKAKTSLDPGEEILPITGLEKLGSDDSEQSNNSGFVTAAATATSNPRASWQSNESVKKDELTSKAEDTSIEKESWRASFAANSELMVRSGEGSVMDKQLRDNIGSVPNTNPNQQRPLLENKSTKSSESVASTEHSDRIKELLRTKGQYHNVVWEAHYNAAKYREQGIGAASTSQPQPMPSPSVAGDDTAALHARIKELEGLVGKYKRDLEKSIDLTRALQKIVSLKEKNRIINPKSRSKSDGEAKKKKNSTQGIKNRNGELPTPASATDQHPPPKKSSVDQKNKKLRRSALSQSKRSTDYPDVPF